MLSNCSQILYGAWTISASCVYPGLLKASHREQYNPLFCGSIFALSLRNAFMQAELALKASPLGSRASHLSTVRWVVTFTPFLVSIAAQNQLPPISSLAVMVGKVSDRMIVAASCYLCLTREHRLMAISTLACRSICFAYSRIPLTNEQEKFINKTHFCLTVLGCLFLGNTIQKIVGVVLGVPTIAIISRFFIPPTETMDPQSQIATLAKLMGTRSPSSELTLKEQYQWLKKYATTTFAQTHHPDKTQDPLKHEQFKQVQKLLNQLKSNLEPEGLTVPLSERVRNLTHMVTDIQIALKKRRETVMMWEANIATNAPPPREDELSEMENVIERLSQCLS